MTWEARELAVRISQAGVILSGLIPGKGSLKTTMTEQSGEGVSLVRMAMETSMSEIRPSREASRRINRQHHDLP